LPSADIRTVRISPDGQHTAVASLILGKVVNPISDGEFEIYNSDGTVLQNLGKVAFANIGEATRLPFAQIAWSLDSNFLVYAEHDPNDLSQMQIMLYRPKTAENIVLLTHLDRDNYAFSISRDSQYIAVFTPYNEYQSMLRLVRADGKISSLPNNDPPIGNLPIFREVKWSPDGKMLAFEMRDSQDTGYQTAIIVGQDGTEIRQFQGNDISTLLWTTCSQQ
jgi:Tol biopolymer transport system component